MSRSGYVTKSQVSAAFALAVRHAKEAGVDVEGWVLFESGSAYAIMRRDDEGSMHPVIPGYYNIGATKREALDAIHMMRAAWMLVPTTPKPGVHRQPCFHVEAGNGLTYGVAARSNVEAETLVLRRLLGEGTATEVTKVTRMGNWKVEHGTVLCYGETL